MLIYVVSAVQIKVPVGQPSMPGADASIPANVYENYSHINENTQKEAWCGSNLLSVVYGMD